MTVLLFAILAATATPAQIVVRPGPAETLSATLSGAAPGARGGAFSGTLSVNGSPVGLPVSGRAEPSGNRLRVPVTLRYADVPQDWANRFRPATFDYRLSGRVAGGQEVQWAGTARWDDVGVEGERETVRRFVRLATLEVTDVSLSASTARAVLAVRNPFAFPLTIASTRYRLGAGGRLVGQGQTRGMILRPRQESTLLLPIDVEHSDLVAAAGRAIFSRSDVPARLSGTVTLRLPHGDVAVPIDLTGNLSIL